METVNILAITQVRYGSSRLPGKVLKKINNKTLLQIHIQRVLQSKKISRLIIATTEETECAQIIEIAKQCGVSYFQGSLNNVLDRYYQAALLYKPDYVVRLTSDCPLIDGDLIDEVIAFTLENGLDYASNVFEPSYPDGQDIEVFKYSALEKAWQNATLDSDKEHVTPYIRNHSSYYNVNNYLFTAKHYNKNHHFKNIRLTVDEEKDFKMLTALINQMGDNKSWLEYTRFLVENKEINNINSGIERNGGYINSLKKGI